MSYREFQRYLDNHFNEKKIQFIKDILPKIKDLVKDSFKASFREINPAKRLNCMEILGYDFMIDSNFKPWLIEVNTNPCLELSSNLLGVIIPAMLENALKIAIDPLFPPGPGKTPENFTENKFELVFHELIDG
jgi:tubulin polyglutamylase TTLL1/tubulin monoglycylase TTLL3/8